MWFSEEGAESQLWGWHNDKATPTLRDTPEGQVDRIWTQKHTSTVVILRDQIEDRPRTGYGQTSPSGAPN